MESQFKRIESSTYSICLSLYVSSLSFSQLDHAFYSIWANYWTDFTIIKIYTRLFSSCSPAHFAYYDWNTQLRIHRHWPKIYFNSVHMFCLKYPYCIYQDIKTADQAKMVRRERHSKKKKNYEVLLTKCCFVFPRLKTLVFFLGEASEHSEIIKLSITTGRPVLTD